MPTRIGIGNAISLGFTPFGGIDALWLSTKPDINTLGANRADAKLTIPTYTPGDTDQGCTHPDVIDFQTQWNGYRYWMIMTPLPEVDPDDYENPSILVSNDLTTWIVPPGVTNPIYPAEAFGYQSDPDLIYIAPRLYCIWRGRNESGDVIIQYGYSTDGINWSTRADMVFDSVVGSDCLSPSIIKEATGYAIYLSHRAVPAEDYELRKYTCATIEGTWTLATTVIQDYSLCNPVLLPDKTGAGIAAWYVWHLNVVKIGTYYYMIVMTRGTSSISICTYLAESSDGETFVFAKDPIFNHDWGGYGAWDAFQYRSTIIPFIENGESKFHIFYGAMYNEYNGYPYTIGYAKIEAKDSYIEIDETTNSIKSTLRDAELVIANAHEQDYVFADDFDRVLETVDGLGTASDGMSYSGKSSGYWRVSGVYAYLRLASNSYIYLEAGADYLASMILEVGTLIFYVKYIDATNYISINVGTGQIYMNDNGAAGAIHQFYPRYNKGHITQYDFRYESGVITITANGVKEAEYTLTTANFASGQTGLDAMNSEASVQFRVSGLDDKIYDLTLKTL